MKKESVKTFWATIYIGFKNCDTGKIVGTIKKTRRICQRYANDISLCVTIKPVKYIYYKGNEKGVEIGLINYPRFPERPKQIEIYALGLAEKLMLAFEQYRVSIVMPTETIMLSNDAKRKTII